MREVKKVTQLRDEMDHQLVEVSNYMGRVYYEVWGPHHRLLMSVAVKERAENYFNLRMTILRQNELMRRGWR